MSDKMLNNDWNRNKSDSELKTLTTTKIARSHLTLRRKRLYKVYTKNTLFLLFNAGKQWKVHVRDTQIERTADDIYIHF